MLKKNVLEYLIYKAQASINSNRKFEITENTFIWVMPHKYRERKKERLTSQR